VRLAHGHREGVKLVEEARTAGCGVYGEGLPSQIGQRVIAYAAGRDREQPVPPGDAAEIFVGYGNGMV
jgi:hypothetical protein